MRRYLAVLVIFLLAAFSEHPAVAQWIRTATGASWDDYGSDVAIDSVGNIYTTGGFKSDVGTFFRLGEGPIDDSVVTRFATSSDVFVAKHNAHGDVQWLVRAGGAQDGERGIAIDLDKDGNVFVAGLYSRYAVFGEGANEVELEDVHGLRFFLAKYRSNGDFIWVARAGSNHGFVHAEANQIFTVDAAGNTTVATYCSDSATFGVSGRDTTITCSDEGSIALARLDSSGASQWVVHWPTENSVRPSSVASDADSNFYVTGLFHRRGTLGGTDRAVTISGGRFYDDIFLAKFDANGRLIWTKTSFSDIQGNSAQNPRVEVADDGTVYLTGFIQDVYKRSEESSTFLASYHSDGGLNWVSRVMPSIHLIPLANGPGELLLLPRGDARLARYDVSTHEITTTDIGTVTTLGFAITPDGGIVLTGSFRNGDSFVRNGTSMVLASYLNSADYFVAKLLNLVDTGTYQPDLTETKTRRDQGRFIIFPNPAAEQVALGFTLEASTDVRIELYDLMGRLVEVPTDHYYASGRHELEVDISSVASGVYLVRGHFGREIETAELFVLSR